PSGMKAAARQDSCPVISRRAARPSLISSCRAALLPPPLKRYAGGKEALEAELYSRFVLVLNEKKAKIRRLQESVSKLQEARNSEEQKSKGSVKSTRSADQDSEEEEDEYGGSTDEEPEEAQSSPSSTPLDDSLRDITDVAPSRKRRYRHLRLQDPGVKRPDTEARQKESPCRTSQSRRSGLAPTRVALDAPPSERVSMETPSQHRAE
uniref:Uncharacterized protein n=1 Tax=Oryzias sinensis TaxID=183150 RepID=A0A8C8DK85_9TELE